jgi:hypothetical protein
LAARYFLDVVTPLPPSGRQTGLKMIDTVTGFLPGGVSMARKIKEFGPENFTQTGLANSNFNVPSEMLPAKPSYHASLRDDENLPGGPKLK